MSRTPNAPASWESQGCAVCRRQWETAERPHFVAAVDTMSEGGMVPAAGGVIVCDASGTIVGAIGVTGDTSDNDEACALAAIEAVGLKAKN